MSLDSFTSKVVHVVWVDSDASAEWTSLEDLEREIKLTHSVGFYVEETESCLIIALSFDPDTESVNNYLRIPHEAVKELKTLCRIKMKLSY